MKTISVVMWDPFQDLLPEYTLEQKVDLIEERFKAAYAWAMKVATPGQDTLVLFMCPEFTLLNELNPTISKSYSKDEMKAFETRLSKLAHDHPGSLIIPGTAYVEKTLKLDDPEKRKKYEKVFFKHDEVKRMNSSPDTNLTKMLASKKHLQDKFLYKNTATLFSSDSTKKRYSKKQSALERVIEGEAIFYPGHGSTFFTTQGVKFGVEICYDHRMGTLREEQKLFLGDAPIDVHLIVSNVININQSKIANDRRNILLINCAGNFSFERDAQKHTGIWIGDSNGVLQEIPMHLLSLPHLRLYPNIELPSNQLKVDTPRPAGGT